LAPAREFFDDWFGGGRNFCSVALCFCYRGEMVHKLLSYRLGISVSRETVV